MITKINLNKVASYKEKASLETDKPLNLIYGLNGTGKSTLSNYLLKRNRDKFKYCSIEGLNENHDILVYNQTFIRENFFESESLKGIFTLSKENKEAEINISNAKKKIEELNTILSKKNEEIEKERQDINYKNMKAKDTIWQIKSDFTGGDRVLEFCLEGYKGSKDNLFNKILNFPKPKNKPGESVDDLKNKIQEISGDNAKKYSAIPEINLSLSNIEKNRLFNKVIVGNENSSVAGLITELGNSDWVKLGLKYISEKTMEENNKCPFCQEKTISKQLIENIKQYFDDSYETDINSIKKLLEEYEDKTKDIFNKTVFESNPKFELFKKNFYLKFTSFEQAIKNNVLKIKDKINNPSKSITLKDNQKILKEINEIIAKINASILEHNNKIEQKDKVRNDIKNTFWDIVRWKYSQTIDAYLSDKKKSDKELVSLENVIKENKNKISEQELIISEQQKQTVNIEEAISNINTGLVELGITDFRIENYSEKLYRIFREGNNDNVFRCLSEGEKMIISFLYFIEMCKGKKAEDEIEKKKIIVIDDPVSSLSHIYVFNIGRLIKNEFFGKKITQKDKETGKQNIVWKYKYEQVFILTHSLYFFYEITETNHDYRKETQKLFRLIKNNEGSKFQSMKYEEVQNDYQAYWYIIKDENQHPALIANCMRNIIEYFFNFVEKKDLNNFFQNSSLKENRFQAFYRYINRESHSLGQNIFDFKEFNYKDFKDGFAELFKVTGYEEHYKKMIK